jgi:predicted transcriptional regulator YdeE
MYPVEEITMPSMRVAGLPARVSNAEPEKIGALWQRFYTDETLQQLTERARPSPIAVYTEYESDYTGEYTMVVGYAIAAGAAVPAGLRVVEIPAQKYAVLLASGAQPQATIQTWQWVWASALERAYTADFDEYLTANDTRVHVAVR